MIDRKGKIESLPLLPKREVAEKVLDKVAALLLKPRTRRLNKL
jgi:hypothetical protein